jgi:hypothetical protein
MSSWLSTTVPGKTEWPANRSKDNDFADYTDYGEIMRCAGNSRSPGKIGGIG